jgi:NAD(P)-dependent dehydrogenase (short-subunit alcohol dehydrogenase family)
MPKQGGGGRIVSIIGNDGSSPWASRSPPSAANAADIAVTVALADQYGRHKILVNAINPGPVQTERWDQIVRGIAKVQGISAEEAQRKALLE